MIDTVPLAGTLDGEAMRAFKLDGKEYSRGTKIPRAVLADLPALNYRGMVNGGMIKLLTSESQKKTERVGAVPSLTTILGSNFRELRRLAKKHGITLTRTDKTDDVINKLKTAFNY